VLLATKSYIQNLNVSGADLANACVDAVNPIPAQSYPESSADSFTRFFNTCGNRYCVKKGFVEGRVVEYYAGSAVVECRKIDPPPQVSDSCKQKLLSLPAPVVSKSVTIDNVAGSCIDSANPTLEESRPSSSSQVVRFVYTCGARWCRSLGQGFSSGRVIEYYGSSATVNCYQEEIFNQLEAGTIVTRNTVALSVVARQCIDSAVPTEAANYPSLSSQNQLRFVNTCGNRYCVKNNLGASGWVIEMRPASSEADVATEVMCVK